MIVLIKLAIKNMIGMLMTKTMLIWGLKFAVKNTKNKVDDNIVLLAEGALDNDEAKVKSAISELTKIYKNK